MAFLTRKVALRWLLLLCFVSCLVNGGVFLVLRHIRQPTSSSDNTPVVHLHKLSDSLKTISKTATKAVTTTATSTTTTTTADKTVSNGSAPPAPCQRVPEPLPLRARLLPCDWRKPKPACPYRFQIVLHCKKSSVSITEKKVKVGTPPISIAFGDACLARAARERCSQTGHLVPSIVHYVLFSPSGKQGTELPVHTFLGLVSVVRFLQPCLLLFHADYLPFGKYWEALLQLTSRVVHVNRTAPGAVFGRTVQKIQHKSDVARLEAMIAFGGIYMDTDEVVLRPLDDLMRHHVTLAWERAGKAFGNGMFLAEPNSTFVKAWHQTYRNFTNTYWSYFSTAVPYQLYRRHPEMNVTVVDTFFRPNFRNITELFYDRPYDWSDHYALHLYYRTHWKHFRGEFERKNTSLGEISRHVFFGDKTRCL